MEAVVPQARQSSTRRIHFSENRIKKAPGEKNNEQVFDYILDLGHTIQNGSSIILYSDAGGHFSVLFFAYYPFSAMGFNISYTSEGKCSFGE